MTFLSISVLVYAAAAIAVSMHDELEHSLVPLALSIPGVIISGLMAYALLNSGSTLMSWMMILSSFVHVCVVMNRLDPRADA